MRYLPCLLGLALATGCALKGDVRKVELQVQALRAESARADSARVRDRDSLLVAIANLERLLAAQQQALAALRGEVRGELQGLKQEVALLQELTGQSQQRLSELRRRLETQPATVPHPPATPADSAGGAGPPGAPVGPSGNPAGPSADQMYDVSLQQFRRGSLATARLGFQEMLRIFPTHERAPDALFYIGETWGRDNPDSAAAAYQLLAQRYASSTRAPSALYKLGLLAEQRGDRASARQFYTRLVASYPRSDEASLARDKLQRTGP